MTVQKSLTRRGVKVLIRFVRTHPKPFSVAMVGAVLYAGAAVLGTIVLGRLTDKVLAPSFDGGVSASRVWFFVAAIVIAALLRSAGVILRRYSAAVTSRRMQVTLRSAITEKYLAAPMSWLRDTPTGQLLAHADSDVEAAVEAINPLPLSLGLVALIVFAVISLVSADPVLSLIGLCLFPSLFVLNRFYTHRIEAPAAAAQACVGAVSAIAHESFDGVMVVKSLGLESHEVDRLAAAADRLQTERLKIGRLRAVFEPLLDVLPSLGAIAVLAVGAWRVSNGAMTPGDMVQVIATFNLLAFPMRVLGFLLEEISRSVVAMDRIDGVLSAPSVPVPTQAKSLPDGLLSLECDDLGYSFTESDVVLEGCCLRVEPGEVVALVGVTGTGKSTLCELFAGMMSQDSGSLRVGGTAYQELSTEDLHREVALVFQESFLFADTVLENLTFGTASSEDAARALRVAQADRFVAALGDGLETVLGERGVTLSGGQRQRIALARALARNPRVLILDDATSAIDPIVEARILDGLRNEFSVTTLIVAHRVSTIALADRVAILRQGRIAATGTHAELLATDADYRALVYAYEHEGKAVS